MQDFTHLKLSRWWHGCWRSAGFSWNRMIRMLKKFANLHQRMPFAYNGWIDNSAKSIAHTTAHIQNFGCSLIFAPLPHNPGRQVAVGFKFKELMAIDFGVAIQILNRWAQQSQAVLEWTLSRSYSELVLIFQTIDDKAYNVGKKTVHIMGSGRIVYSSSM